MECPDAEALRARADCACRVKPARAARLRLEAYNDERMLGALSAAKMRRAVATVGEILTAYRAPGTRILRKEDYARNNVNALYRVLAHALNLWKPNPGGPEGVRGVKLGADIPDRARIDALASSVLTAETREAYFRAAQGGDLDWNEPREGNTTINSTMRQACDLFSRNAMYHKLRGLVLPADLSGFLKGPFLPEKDPVPQPLAIAEFETMVREADLALARGNRELWLCNLLLRRTALRSDYVIAARRSWMVEHEGCWFLEIRNRPEEGFRKKRGTRDQLIPLDSELAGALGAHGPHGESGHLLLPTGTPAQRAWLVDREHNAWLKGKLGLATRQGNHRLRDTVASVLWSEDRPTAAQEALGHSSVDTTAKHYGRKIHVAPLMREELRAWTE